MGTSNKYGGPGGTSALVPSWLNPEPNIGDQPSATNEPGQQQNDPNQPDKNNDDNKSEPPNKDSTQAGEPNRFTSARKSFNSFTKSGDSKYLRRAVSEYVRKGTGGSSNAAQRMAPSSLTAARLGGFIDAVKKKGFKEAVKTIGVADLQGKSPEQIRAALTDAFCPASGPIDDSISRHAWNEALLGLADQDITDLATLTPEQWNSVFEDFITRSIEARVINDIGNGSVHLPADVNAINQAQATLHDLISGAVRDAIGDRLLNAGTIPTKEVQGIMNQIYKRAFAYLEALGEE
jgi:hypothetical protein